MVKFKIMKEYERIKISKLSTIGSQNCVGSLEQEKNHLLARSRMR